ncbi:DNRLRE domain-containing protein [Paenibacillus sp. J5C_2022]|uniref:CBM96 family carbohydrate-binding protein n=1 Tax=Paenibacillus sp. J5C2022 TaxID=2977129 RepID=UPI0021CFD388|nr:DNRLRE domain-containing protein [Paenibacillus sp. J5C2022]MCU6711329.1 DNRLRE domain-containing protein [Paenibacillus sp. J5C2022]
MKKELSLWLKLLIAILIVHTIGAAAVPGDGSRAKAASPGPDDGGLIAEDEMNSLSLVHASQDVAAIDSSVSPLVSPTEVEGDPFLFAANGGNAEIVYKKGDIRSFVLVAYRDPQSQGEGFSFSVSSDGAAFTSIEPAVVNEGASEGSWDRLVYEWHGAAEANYLKLAWNGGSGTSALYASKIRIGYTGGVWTEDAGFRLTATSDLHQPGGWETRYAKLGAGAAPDLTVSIESGGGAPGSYVKLADQSAASEGMAMIGQTVRLPDFFSGPEDFTVSLDYRLFGSGASQSHSLRLVILPVPVWNQLSQTANAAGTYNPSSELYAYMLYDGTGSADHVKEWSRVTTEGQDIAAALQGYAGDDVVVAIAMEAASGHTDEAHIDNVEINAGEMTLSRPHFVAVKAIRDRLFGYRWASDVLQAYRDRYDIWLTRDIALIPDSSYIWENRFNDPDYNVPLVYEYMSYQDILASGYDYDTYYQIAEFESPGLDPGDPSDDYIISSQNTDPNVMDQITRGWYAKWVTDHTNAAKYLAYLYILTGESAYAEKAAEIVNEFAAKYPQYEEHDVVEPARDFATRLFYSPLNEAAYFVTPMVFAVDSLYNSGEFNEADKAAIRTDMFYPATDAIKFSHRMNNFQVIQNTALGLTGYLYDDSGLISDALLGYAPSKQDGTALGMFDGLLELGVGEDGFWFEGSPSYHSFVLKHYIYLANAALRFGSEDRLNLYEGNERFKSMFDALLRLPYPDLTLQANNDSVYKPNLLTPMYLWMMETADRAYSDIDSSYREYMNQAYGMASVSRSDAELYSLLFGYAAIPETSEPFLLSDANMTGLGSLLTRNHVGGETYMSTLDYGPHTGGHDHYDKLNVTTYGNGRVWLDDLGMSPYGTVSAEQYYRKSAAHNTVVVPDKLQAGMGGSFLAQGHTRSMHFSAASADGIYPDVQQYRRAVIMVDDWMLDVFKLRTYDSVTFDWFAHVPESSMNLSLPVTAASGMLGSSEGYPFIELQAEAFTSGNWHAEFTDAVDSQNRYRITMLNDAPMQVYESRSFGRANMPGVQTPVLTARQTVNGAGEFVALHEFSPGGSQGIASAQVTEEGVEVAMSSGESYHLQYDISHATEETSFKLVKQDSGGAVTRMEIANDNRLSLDGRIYASSDQVLSGLSVEYGSGGTVDIANTVQEDSNAQKTLTSFTFYYGAGTLNEVRVDGVPAGFSRDGDYVTVQAPMAARPTLRNRQFTLNASEDAYAKEVEPDRVLGHYTTLGLRNSGTSSASMAAYLKFDLGTYTGNQVNEAKLRFYAYDNAAPYNPIELAVYGIADNGWSEESLTWNNAPLLGKDQSGKTVVTDMGVSSWYIDKVSLADGNYSWFEVDVSAFVQEHGGGGEISFIVLPEDQGYSDWIFMTSKESGTRPPQLMLREHEDLAVVETGYIRGGQYEHQQMDGTVLAEVMDAPIADDDRITYMKFDMGSYSGSELGKGILQFRASAPGAVGSVAVSVYGITDDSWTESSLTWADSPNHAEGDTGITGVGNTAIPIATLYVDSEERTYAVDATRFLQGRLSSSHASFLLTDLQDGNVLVKIDGRLGPEPPVLSMYEPVKEEVQEAAFIWGGSYADGNYEYSSHLVVKNAAGTGADRKSYIKLDLSGLKTERVNRALLRLYGKNSTSPAATPVSAYGILDNNWSADAITFNAAPNHDPLSGNVTGIGTTAYLLDTVEVNGTAGYYEWDISDFLYTALKRGESELSVVLAIEEEYGTSYIDFNSHHGIIPPLLLLEH